MFYLNSLLSFKYAKCIIQGEPEITGIRKLLLNSSYGFKYSNEHETQTNVT